MSGLLIRLVKQDIKKDDRIFGFIGSSDYSNELSVLFLSDEAFLAVIK